MTTTCWQQLLNEGDYIGAYISQQCPCFVPGDGSWADFYFRLLHHIEQPPRWTEGEFLQCVSHNTQNNDSFVLPYKDYWKMYTELSRLYQQPIQVCVFFASVLQYSPMDWARAMARRGDVEGQCLVLQHVSPYLQPSSWEWIEELSITLSPRAYLQWIPLLCHPDDNDDNQRHLNDSSRKCTTTRDKHGLACNSWIMLLTITTNPTLMPSLLMLSRDCARNTCY